MHEAYKCTLEMGFVINCNKNNVEQVIRAQAKDVMMESRIGGGGPF